MPSARTRSERLRKYLRGMASDWQLYALIALPVVWIFLIDYVPMNGILISFEDYRIKAGIFGSKWVGLKWYKKFIEYPAFWKILLNTLRISIYDLATFPLSMILALLINELNNKVFKKTVQMITYMPHFISTVVICSMLTLFMNRSNGLFNNVIAFFGGERKAFMENASLFPGIYVWSGVWQGIGWGSIIYLSALSSVSPELVEAAKIDGATRMQIIWHVNIPTILPTFVILLIMRCGSVLSVGYGKILLLQNSLNLDTSQVISTYVYQLGFQDGQWSYSSAIGMFNTVVNVICLLSVNALARRVSDVGLW